MYRILILIIVLIVHGSLYPWKFHAPPAAAMTLFWNAWPRELTRFVLRDAMLNVFVYIPLGIFGYMAWRQRDGRRLPFVGPAVLALVLSLGVEMLQLCDDVRTSSPFDVVCDVAGAAFGTLLGCMCEMKVSRAVKWAQYALRGAPSSALLLLCCWLGHMTYPLFPVFSRTVVGYKLMALFLPSSFSASAALATLIEWLVVACMLEAVLDVKTARTILPFMLLLLPARLLIYGRTVALSDIVGAVAAYVIFSGWLVHSSRRTNLLAWLVMGDLILQGLAPYHWQSPPAPFSWIPFQSTLESNWDGGLTILLRKAFWYGAAVWLFRRAGFSFARSTVAVAGVLMLIEWTQQRLPGRSPEITDPLLAVMLACTLWLLERHIMYARTK